MKGYNEKEVIDNARKAREAWIENECVFVPCGEASSACPYCVYDKLGIPKCELLCERLEVNED